MPYRILCDEHVDPQTVGYLERDGHDATHVTDAIGAGATDEQISSFARRNEYVILTNDTDFLDTGLYGDVTVLQYTDHREQAHSLAALVDKLTKYCPAQEDLPSRFYLSEENL